MTLHQHPHKPRALPGIRLATALRLLALLGLFLLPIQMRAGTGVVHPHALLHLLLDISDGSLDHHLLGVRVAPDHAHSDEGSPPSETATASPDLPNLASIQMAAGGLVVSLVAVILLLIIYRQERVWPRREAWSGRRVLPELPPPRLCGI